MAAITAELAPLRKEEPRLPRYQDATRPLTFQIPPGATAGRHVFPLWAAPSADRSGEQLTDTFLAVDVTEKQR